MFAEHWILTEDLNCYSDPNGDQFGAEKVEPDSWEENRDRDSFKKACVGVLECTGFIWGQIQPCMPPEEEHQPTAMSSYLNW